MGASLYGDWSRAGIVLRNLATKLKPIAQAKLYEDGQVVLETMQNHITNQDLNWTPLAPSTVRAKKGDTTIYVETGELQNGLTVRKVKSSADSIVYFVGASPWKKHKKSGLKYSDLMIYLEYGTSKIPPRPLIQPTYEEVKNDIQQSWRDTLSDIIGG